MIYKISDSYKMTDCESKIIFEREFLGEKETAEVSGAGVEFLRLLDGKKDINQILEECIRIFGNTVEPYNLARDLENFYSELAGEGIITVVTTPFIDHEWEKIAR